MAAWLSKNSGVDILANEGVKGLKDPPKPECFAYEMTCRNIFYLTRA